MSIRLSRVAMRLNHRVLGQQSYPLVHPTKVHRGLWRRSLALTIDLEGGCVDYLRARIGPEGFQGGDLSACGAAHTPGLLQDSGAPLAAGIQPLSHIVVAP